MSGFKVISFADSGVALVPQEGANFGAALAGLGDLGGDGSPDLVVGAPGQDGTGAVYVVSFDSDGSVGASIRVSDATSLADGDSFGSSVAFLGDVDGDGVGDIAVGAPGDDGASGANTGAVYIIFMNADGTSKGSSKIADGTDPSVLLSLDANDEFGRSLAFLGAQGDGTFSLAVGSVNAVSVLSLRVNAGAASLESVSTLSPPAGLADDSFGSSISALRDVYSGPAASSPAGDLAVGAPASGTVCIITLDGTLVEEFRSPIRDSGSEFGAALAIGEDLDGNGVPEQLIGAPREDGGGAQHTIFMPRQDHYHRRVGYMELGLPPQADFGRSIALLGRLDGDNLADLVVGAAGMSSAGLQGVGGLVVLFTAPVHSPPPPALPPSPLPPAPRRSPPGGDVIGPDGSLARAGADTGDGLLKPWAVVLICLFGLCPLALVYLLAVRRRTPQEVVASAIGAPSRLMNWFRQPTLLLQFAPNWRLEFRPWFRPAAAQLQTPRTQWPDQDAAATSSMTTALCDSSPPSSASPPATEAAGTRRMQYAANYPEPGAG